MYSGALTQVGTTKVTPIDIQSGVGLQQRMGAEYRLGESLTVQSSIGHCASEAMGINERSTHALGTLNGDHYEMGVVLYY